MGSTVNFYRTDEPERLEELFNRAIEDEKKENTDYNNLSIFDRFNTLILESDIRVELVQDTKLVEAIY